MSFARMRAQLLLLAWWGGLYLPPDRRVLERIILPELAKLGGGRPVLFVGVRFYTRHYSRLFRDAQLVTMDADPRMRRYGAPEHAVERVENLTHCFPPRSLDAIVMNGVIGWGLDTPAAVDAALAACATGLVAGGMLVLGLNERRATTPSLEGLEAMRRFEPVAFPGVQTDRLVVPTPFAEREHTFLFFRKRAEAPVRR
jgi:hypothetical protein